MFVRPFVSRVFLFFVVALLACNTSKQGKTERKVKVKVSLPKIMWKLKM
jgi:hypothetical protein